MTIRPTDDDDSNQNSNQNSDQNSDPKNSALEPTIIGPMSDDGGGMKSSEDDNSSSDSGPPLPGAKGRADASGGLHVPDIDGYFIRRRLGDGGFADVFEAKRVSLDLTVAIKLLNPKASRRGDVVQRFQREIKAYHNLTDANVVQYRTDGVCERGYYAGCPYIIMEYMDVGTLRDWLRKIDLNSAACLRSAIRILADVCRGLSFLHGRGVVHRDLKPENVLLSDLKQIPLQREYDYGLLDTTQNADSGDFDQIFVHPRQVKLTDFGLTTYRDDDSGGTVEGATLGTFPYMPREQLEDAASVTTAADQYAVGVMIYEVLCGRRPWQSNAEEREDRNLVASRTLSKTRVPLPTSEERRIDRRLKDICLRCLEPDPADRYEHIDHVREELEAWLNNEPEVRPPSKLKRLWRDIVIRPLKRNPIRFLSSIAACIMLIFGGSWIWQKVAYEWPSVSYFHDVIECWGVFEGIQPLSESEFRKRNSSYRITKRGWYGPTLMVERITGHGTLEQSPGNTIEHWGFEFEDTEAADALAQQESRYVYSYTGDGTVSSIVAEDFRQQQLWKKTYSSINQARFEVFSIVTKSVAASDRLALVAGISSAADGHLVQAWKGSRATMVRYRYDKKGLKTAVVFMDDEGHFHPNGRGVFGYQDNHDALGRVIKRVYLGADGNPILSKYGLAGWEASHTHTGYTITNLDRERKPCVSKFGLATAVTELDGVGNVSKRRFFDPLGNPTTHVNLNHGFDAEYDERGNRSVLRIIGIDGSIAPDKYGPAETRTEYDAAGRVVNLRMFDETGRPTTHVDGHHGFDRVYDANGNLTRERYIGVDGNSAFVRAGYAELRCTYDLLGRRITDRFFDDSGKPTTAVDGNHGRDVEYDARGNQTLVRYIGMDGQPTVVKDGFAESRSTYDALGREISVRYFDDSGKRTTHVNGEHGWNAEYDGHGNRTLEQNVGVDGQATTIKSGYSEARMTYDVFGRRKSIAFFDVNREPSTDADGIHKLETSFDDRERLNLESYFGVDGQLVPSSVGAEMVGTTRDEFGNAIEYRYFDANREARIGSDGSHGLNLRYDSRGNLIWAQHVDVNESPVDNNTGISETRIECDGLGRSIKVTVFNSDGQPADNESGVHGSSYQYDRWGNLTSKKYIGADGQSVPGDGGYAEERGQFNLMGRLVSVSFFDVTGARVIILAGKTNPSAGYHSQRFEYDRLGRVVVERFIGIDGNAVEHNFGWAEERSSYDRLGRPTQIRLFGADGEPVLSNVLFHGLDFEYDDRGNKTALTYIGMDGEPTELRNEEWNGVATKRMRYNHLSQLIEERYFDRNDAPAGTASGKHGVNYVYRGRKLERTIDVGLNGSELRKIGVKVVSVVADSNADRSGIKVGDKFVSYNGKSLTDVEDLNPEILSTENSAPQKIAVVLERDGQKVELEVNKGKLGVSSLQVYAPNDDSQQSD